MQAIGEMCSYLPIKGHSFIFLLVMLIQLWGLLPR